MHRPKIVSSRPTEHDRLGDRGSYSAPNRGEAKIMPRRNEEIFPDEENVKKTKQNKKTDSVRKKKLETRYTNSLSSWNSNWAFLLPSFTWTFEISNGTLGGSALRREMKTHYLVCCSISFCANENWMIGGSVSVALEIGRFPLGMEKRENWKKKKQQQQEKKITLKLMYISRCFFSGDQPGPSSWIPWIKSPFREAGALNGSAFLQLPDP